VALLPPRPDNPILIACGKLPEQCKFSWSKTTMPSASHWQPGFVVKLRSDSRADAAAALSAPPADLVLLDLGLPTPAVFEVCRQLRTRSSVPIIIVTARDDETDRVVGLELGADDYVVKPLASVARRPHTRSQPSERVIAARAGSQVIGGLEIDRRSTVCCWPGRTATYSEGIRSARSSRSRSRAMVTRREILARSGILIGTVLRRQSMSHRSLRKKLGNPKWIETSRGVGFRLAVPQ